MYCHPDIRTHAFFIPTLTYILLDISCNSTLKNYCKTRFCIGLTSSSQQLKVLELRNRAQILEESLTGFELA